MEELALNTVERSPDSSATTSIRLSSYRLPPSAVWERNSTFSPSGSITGNRWAFSPRSTPKVGRVDDSPVRGPGATATLLDRRQRLDRPPRCGDPLQVRPTDERDVAAIGRPERIHGSFRAFEKPRRRARQRADPQPTNAILPQRHQSHLGTIRRQRQAIAEIEGCPFGRQDRTLDHGLRYFFLGEPQRTENDGCHRGQGSQHPRELRRGSRLLFCWGHGSEGAQQCRSLATRLVSRQRDSGLADVPQSRLGIPIETTRQQCASRLWNRSRKGLTVDLVPEHRRQGVGDRVAFEEALAGQHLPQHDSESPDVGSPIGLEPFGLLRAHVGRGAQQHAGSGHLRGERRGHGQALTRRTCALRLERLREPEIQHLDLAVWSDLDVGGLQVPMDDALLVGRLQRLGDLQRDGHGLVYRQRTASQPLGQIFAGSQFHDEEVDGRARGLEGVRAWSSRAWGRKGLGAWVLGPGSWACPLPGAHKGRPYIRIGPLGVLKGIDGRYVGVVEGGEDLGFALEAGEALWIGGHRFGQHLDRDLSAQLRVVGKVDLTHATFTKLGGDLEMGKIRSNHQ